ncbi:complement C1s subcomponent [Rhinophrynus dorsalis]
MGFRVLLLLALLGWVHSGSPDLYGNITSPNYPQGYPNNADESWAISVREGFGIRLYFTHLDIEPSENCENDFLEVMVGDIVKGKLCGRRFVGSQATPIEERYFPSNSLTLHFKSDFSNQERFTGFAAYYVAVDVDECEESSESICSHFCNNYIGGYFCSCLPDYYLYPDNHTCGVNCSGGLYTDLKGQISSPGYPSTYPENTRCDYRISLERGFQVVVTFQIGDFDIEAEEDGSCSYDSLTIRAGGRTFGPYCGSDPPDPPRIDTGSNEVEIIFQTDSGGENRGWRIHYSEDAIPCPMEVTPHSVMDPKKHKYIFNDIVTVRCTEGYEIVIGQKTLRSFQSRCQGDGTWTNSKVQCEAVNCGEPEDIENGFVNLSSTTYGSVIDYNCASEYYTLTLPGTEDASYRCSADGFWVNKNGRKDLPKCTAVCGIYRTFPGTKIIGGAKACRGQFPWQILFTAPQLGSGALISDRWVLTAAHVVQENPYPQMFGGIIRRPKKLQQNLHAKKIIIHPKYRNEDDNNFDNDIALIQLTHKVKLGPCISPICLPRTGLSPNINDIAFVAGWGQTEKEDEANFLMFTKVPLSSMDQCDKAAGKEGKITKNMLCAGGTGSDSCKGDSGGPLMFLDTQGLNSLYAGGIVSWGPADCGTYALYTKVENYQDWIKETIEEVEKEDDETDIEIQEILCVGRSKECGV